MAEILTESFCERCGTRYTFESPARRTNPLGALGTVGRGLRNFVNSGDQTIDEAFAVARAETEQRATAHQLEAFHQTFNFCLSCRQYTCSNCWNPVEGRCQSCAPMPEAEMLPAADATPDSPVIAEAMAIAWAATTPPAELEIPPAAEPEMAEPEAVYEPAPEPVLETTREPEPEPVPEPELAPEPEAVIEPEPEPVGPAPAPRATSLPSLPPGISLDEEIAAYELRIAALAVPPSSASPQPMAPMAAAPEVIQATPRVPIFIASAVPDLPPPSPVAMPTAQTGACTGCGLALSATARFCRRCGTPQHQ